MPKDIMDRLDQDATGWRPEIGDKVVGKVVEISERDGEWGTYPLVVLELDGGELIALHAFHQVFKSELARLRPSEGDRLGVKYLGIPPGKRYESYRVALERASGTSVGPDWDRMGAEAQQELGAETPVATSTATAQPAAAAPVDDDEGPW